MQSFTPLSAQAGYILSEMPYRAHALHTRVALRTVRVSLFGAQKLHRYTRDGKEGGEEI